jgi:hypothetical protein
MAKPSAPDPAIGTWKLDVARSSFKLFPAFKSYVLKNEAWEDGLKAIADIVDDQKNKRHAETAYKFDGKDYPLKGSPLADAISAKRINERSVEFVWKKDGKIVLNSKAVVSSDSKTLTSTLIGMDAQGRDAQNVLIFEKQ